MKRANRITRSADFTAIRAQGNKYVHPLVMLNSLATDNGVNRVAVIASKALGGAVIRNRVKRRIRASMSTLLPMITPGWDLVIIARKNLIEADSQALQNALREVLTQAGVIWDD